MAASDMQPPLVLVVFEALDTRTTAEACVRDTR